MTGADLVKSGVGLAIVALRKHGDAQISSRAAGLRTQWKAIVVGAAWVCLDTAPVQCSVTGLGHLWSDMAINLVNLCCLMLISCRSRTAPSLPAQSRQWRPVSLSPRRRNPLCLLRGVQAPEPATVQRGSPIQRAPGPCACCARR